MWVSRVRIEYANIQIGDITYSNVISFFQIGDIELFTYITFGQ